MTNRMTCLARIVGVLFLLSLTACGAGGGDSPAENDDSAGASVAVSRSAIAINDVDCPNGGIRVDTGIDENRNGILDTNEVDLSEKVCHGTNGKNSLVNTIEELPGTHCTNGGVQFQVGLDLNGNSVLDPLEVGSTHYICNGSADGSEGNPPVGEVDSVILHTEQISKTITLGEATTVDIELSITATGYNSDNPLYVRLSDINEYFPTRSFSVVDFSSDLSFELTSRVFADSGIFSTQLKIDFCEDANCTRRVYGAKTATIEIDVEPRFNSATVLSDSIEQDAIFGQANSIPLGIEFDTEGYDYYNPLYVLVNDGNKNVQTTTMILNDVSGRSILDIATTYFNELGVSDSTLTITFCKDYFCTERLQEPVQINTSITVRHPSISSVPTSQTLSLSQTVLEPSQLNYAINLTSNDNPQSDYWVNVYDPTSLYFDNKTIDFSRVPDAPIMVPLEFKAIDVTSSEARTFEIKSRVCLDQACTTVLSPVPGSTDVTLNVLYPSAELTINETNLSVQGKDATPAPTEVTGTWSVSNLGDLEAYLVATDTSAGTVVNHSVLLPSPGAFALPLELLPQKQLGSYAADVNFQICLEPGCEHVIGSLDDSLSVLFNVNQLAGWATHQRNAAHSGYVPVTLDVTDFSEGWTWTSPSGSDAVTQINPVVAQDGKVIITTDVRFAEATVYMLDEATGDPVWDAGLGNMPALNPPAISEGKVWASTTGHMDTYLHAFDFDTGIKLHSSSFDGQWPHFFAPTPYANSIYQGGGIYGGYVHAFSSADGEEEWQQSLDGAWDMYTPAVTGSYVLHHNGHVLNALNRTTGNIEFEIDDGLPSSTTYSYHGAPMVENNIVVAYAGEAFSGSASSNVEHYDQRYLVGFDLEAKAHIWTSTSRYKTHPAVKDGVLYVGRSSSARVDAIDITTGQVLWFWSSPDAAETSMHRNTIVTDNLLFVSTNSKVHAIDLTTKQSVWTYPVPGMLALSDNKTLLIATGATESDGDLVAVTLEQQD